MTAHVVLMTRAEGRWRDAFADVRICVSVAHAVAETPDAAVVWVDASRIDWIAGLRAARPELPLVAISLNPNAAEGMQAFEAGVRGYCHALAVPELLRQIETVVANGGLWVGAELMARAAATVVRLVPPQADGAAPLSGLTPRERAVAMQVAEGASNKEVAQRLAITPRTVKAHLGAIFDKLGVRDRLQLVLALRRVGASRTDDAPRHDES